MLYNSTLVAVNFSNQIRQAVDEQEEVRRVFAKKYQTTKQMLYLYLLHEARQEQKRHFTRLLLCCAGVHWVWLRFFNLKETRLR